MEIRQIEGAALNSSACARAPIFENEKNPHGFPWDMDSGFRRSGGGGLRELVGRGDQNTANKSNKLIQYHDDI